MGVVPKTIWSDYKGALREKLKYCKTDICTCIAELIDAFMNGHAGLPERFDRMLGPNANQAGINGHVEQYDGRREGLGQAMDAFDDHCGGKGTAKRIYPEAYEYRGKIAPTQEDWERKHGKPMPTGDTGPSFGMRVLYSIGAVGLGVGAAALAAIPFDGPAGEMAAGAGAIALGKMAFE